MVFDFSALDYKEPPVLLLKNLDGTVIQPLGCAFEVTAKLLYNEVSELTFKLPAHIDGVSTPHYDDVTSMRIVDWVGMGQFILVNPKVTSDGICEYKECTAYSLEYELNYKQIYLEDGTYNFWNPVAQDNTVLGVIVSILPKWSIGTVDESLWGKYRTFGVDNTSVYDFIKNTAQDTYQCVFDFDTYQRKINVRSVTSVVATDPVFLSLDNLVKELDVSENTDDIYTCLDVNGAEDVDIRSVNPMGTNKIYNLDHFVTRGYFTDAMAAKWNDWKTTYENSRQLYYNTTVEKVLQEARLETERAALTALESKLYQYNNLQSVYIEAAAQGIDRQAELADVKQKIAATESEIAAKQSLIESIVDEIDALYEQQKTINQSCAFSAFFTEDELDVLGLHIKEGSISESSFVYQTVSSYTTDDIATMAQAVSASFTDGKVTRVQNTSGKEVYSIRGGSLTMTADDRSITAQVVRAAIECKTDGAYIVTAFLNAGTFDEVSFPSGCISLTGSGCSVTSDVVADPEISGSYKEGTTVNTTATTSNLYFTINATEYARRSVEWDLMEFGQEQLKEMSAPSYTFSLDSSNFLALDEFLTFKNQFHLGNKVYLEMTDGAVLSPIVIGAEIELDDPSSLKLVFCDTYSATDEAMKMVDILGQSVSVSKTTAANRFNYSSFVDSGASTSVRDFMTGALNYSKNRIQSATGQGISMDDSGVTLKKSTSTGVSPEQVKMINNCIAFTMDNWESVIMALGKFHDENAGDVYGLSAPAIVGTLLAGSNLVIESAKKDGDTSVFRVDANGAKLYNSTFDLVNRYTYNGASNVGQISLNPTVGLIAGNTASENSFLAYDENGNITGVKTENGSTVKYVDELTSGDKPKTKFWVDMEGNVYLEGNGVFNGNGSFSGTVNAQDFQLNGTSISDIFYVSKDEDDKDILHIGDITIDGTTGEIYWNGSANIVQVRYSTDKTASVPAGWSTEWSDSWNNTNTVVYAIYSYDGGTTWTSPMLAQAKNGVNGSDARVPSYITQTYISSVEIQSPEITGNDIRALRAFLVGENNGYMGYATGAKVDESSLTGTATTYGVALAASDAITSAAFQNNGGIITYETKGHYIIVTTDGVRLQSGTSNLVLTESGLFLNGAAVGAGEDTKVVAVWG